MLQTANNYPSLVGCSSMNIHETHETYEFRFVFQKLTNLCWHPYYQIRGANTIHWLMYYRLQVSRRSHRLELAWTGCKFGGSKSNPRNDHNLQTTSRELTYPTLGSSENHLQNDIFGGYGFVPWRLSVLRIPNSKVAGTWNAFFKPCEVLCDGNTIFEAMATRKPGTLTVWGWNKFQVWNCNTGKIWKKINSWNYDVRSGESQQTKM